MKRLLRRRPSPALVIACIALFAALGPAAYGTHFGSLVLGHPNTANDTTSLSGAKAGKLVQLTNTSTGAGATALGLNVAAGKAPFTVNSTTKVANLNADRLDGIDSTGFLRGKGRAYHGRLRLEEDPEDGEFDVGRVLTVPGFGFVEGACETNFSFTGISRLQFANESGGDLDVWWFNKDGVDSRKLGVNSFADVSGFHADPWVVVLHVSRAGRAATITATKNRPTGFSDDDWECIFSAQAVAQID